ncbi:hypothetical protein BJ742DRAFT_157603 [Cladochytrium replicatum]|nr:hypothetical protein BJ742DRAFT_157603 [Cladochytrium replicatum]
MSFQMKMDTVCSLYYTPTYTVSVLFTFVASPYLFWLLRPIEDTYKIKREIFVNILFAIPIYALYLLWERWFRKVAPGLSVTTPPALFVGGIFTSWIPLFDAVREHNAVVIDRNMMRSEGYESSEMSLKSSGLGNAISECANASVATHRPVAIPMEQSWEAKEKRDKNTRNVTLRLKRIGLGKNGSTEEPLRQGLEGFYQTLSNPKLYKSFREFATQDFTAECCSFYEHYTFLAEKISLCMLHLQSFQREGETPHYASKRFVLSSASAPDSMKPSYFLMKKLFIDPGSELELNIPSAMREEILTTMSVSNPIPMNIFDNTKNEVVYMLFSNTFEKWKALRPQK